MIEPALGHALSGVFGQVVCALTANNRGGNRGTIEDHWTAGRQIVQSILHLMNGSYQQFISLDQVVPGPV